MCDTGMGAKRFFGPVDVKQDALGKCGLLARDDQTMGASVGATKSEAGRLPYSTRLFSTSFAI